MEVCISLEGRTKCFCGPHAVRGLPTLTPNYVYAALDKSNFQLFYFNTGIVKKSKVSYDIGNAATSF